MLKFVLMNRKSYNGLIYNWPLFACCWLQRIALWSLFCPKRCDNKEYNRMLTSYNSPHRLESPLSRARARKNGSSVHSTALSKFDQHSGAEMMASRARQTAWSTDCLPWKCAPRMNQTPWLRWRANVKTSKRVKWLPPLCSSIKPTAKTRTNISESPTNVCRRSHGSRQLFRRAYR